MKKMFPHIFARPIARSLDEAGRSGIGGLLGIFFAGAIATLWLGGVDELPLLVAPMGASAVLLFAVPSSPLAQPWPILGGNTVSALIGVAAAQAIGWPLLAAAVAVAIAIMIMSLMRCLHPPGGAVALTAVIGAPHIIQKGFLFALSPVLINSVLLALAAIIYNRFMGRSYPHKAHPPENPHPLGREIILRENDFEDVLNDYGERLDIGHEDLETLYVELRGRAEARRKDPGLQSASEPADDSQR